MTGSVAEIDYFARVHGPSMHFDVAPNNATRRMLERWHAVYGDVYRITAERDASRHWVIHEPSLVQRILVRNGANYRKGMGLDRVRLLLGDGIMVSEGDFWARQRRLIQPAFKPRRLADFTRMIVAENQRLAERWQDHADARDTVDIVAHISELTLVIVLKSIFGADYDALIAAGDNPFAILTEDDTRDLRFAARFHRLGRVVEDIIELREGGAAAEPGFDFLGHLLAARDRDGAGMSRRELVDEVMTLVVAGHETTASALAWAWYEIANHPRLLARLQREVDALAAGDIADVCDSPDQRLAWVDAVIHETLRLYPPGWLLSRRAIASDQLGDYEIEPGDQLFISPYILHRHAGYWRDPQRFDPARFLAPDTPGHRFAFLPFAAGQRRCIGERMAMTEMRAHLVTMLRRFVPADAGAGPPELEAGINLRPGGGVPLRLRPRQSQGQSQGLSPLSARESRTALS